MSQSDLPVSIASYDINLLMSQTRKLATDYRLQTGQALPVTEELARFDAISILGLSKTENIDGIDATDKLDAGTCEDELTIGRDIDYYLIKGRVIFKSGKARQKLGKLSLLSKWTNLLMVIYNAEYLPVQIYSVKREIIDREMEILTPDKRGSMTVAKYKAIGELVWENPVLNNSDSSTSKANASHNTAESKQIKAKSERSNTKSEQTNTENGRINSVENGQNKIEDK